MSDKTEKKKIRRQQATKSVKLQPSSSVRLKSAGSAEAASSKLPSTGSAKQTVYVDVDDEITTIIERVQSADAKIVALVLPRRAAVLQSVVNMRLLKRTAEQAGKHLVLVTSEAALLPLAGMVGLFVASTPTSKPVIPNAPSNLSDEPEDLEESVDLADDGSVEVRKTANEDASDFDPEAEATTPVGELADTGMAVAGTTLAAGRATQVDEPEDIIIEDDTADDAAPDNDRPDVVTVKKNKKLAVPSFDRFRLRLILGLILLAVLIAGWIFATKVLPKATIAIQTNSQVVRSELNLTLDTSAKSLDVENGIVPAFAQSTQKSYSQQVAATGQQNNGEKAKGSVTFEASVCALPAKKPDPIPAGSSISSGGRTYITQESASFSLSDAGTCVTYESKSVPITALKAGAEYNVSDGTKFSGAGTAIGSASGGTDEIVKIVSQSDIDSAKSKINSQDSSQQNKDLQSALQAKGMMPVPSTFLTSDPQITSSAKAGDQVDAVTVSAVVSYTMLGVKQADLQTMVAENVDKEIDTKKMKILNDGVDKAVFDQQNPGTATAAVVRMKTQSVAGPELKQESIRAQAAGKKAAQVEQSIGDLPGVTEVEVEYSPFWVKSVPTDVTKITVTIAKPVEP